MQKEEFTIRMSVDKEGLLGRLANLERLADEIRFEAVHLREMIKCTQAEDTADVPPEE